MEVLRREKVILVNYDEDITIRNKPNFNSGIYIAGKKYLNTGCWLITEDKNKRLKVKRK